MKTIKITYWISTGILALMMAYSAYSYLTNPEMVQGFAHLGFPDYFRIQLAIAKILGVAALILPIRGRIKEWAYAGFAFNFISAFIAHLASGDPLAYQLSPLVFFLILAVSYYFYHKKEKLL
jgi:uncharacterized membrane protein YphA (DoxX/SURF4 family)